MSLKFKKLQDVFIGGHGTPIPKKYPDQPDSFFLIPNDMQAMANFSAFEDPRDLFNPNSAPMFSPDFKKEYATTAFITGDDRHENPPNIFFTRGSDPFGKSIFFEERRNDFADTLSHEMGHSRDTRVDSKKGAPYPLNENDPNFIDFVQDQVDMFMREGIPEKEAKELAFSESPAMIHEITAGTYEPARRRNRFGNR